MTMERLTEVYAPARELWARYTRALERGDETEAVEHYSRIQDMSKSFWAGAEFAQRDAERRAEDLEAEQRKARNAQRRASRPRSLVEQVFRKGAQA